MPDVFTVCLNKDDDDDDDCQEPSLIFNRYGPSLPYSKTLLQSVAYLVNDTLF